MAGMGPPPKHPSQRRRRNVDPTARTLSPVSADGIEAPALPAGHEWHPLTLDWWADVWASPMAAEYTQADVHGLFILAALVDAFWTSPSKELAGEIRLQRQCFGLTPIDRRRLQWTIDKAGEAEERKKAAAKRTQRADPRLKAVPGA